MPHTHIHIHILSLAHTSHTGSCLHTHACMHVCARVQIDHKYKRGLGEASRIFRRWCTRASCVNLQTHKYMYTQGVGGGERERCTRTSSSCACNALSLSFSLSLSLTHTHTQSHTHTQMDTDVKLSCLQRVMYNEDKLKRSHFISEMRLLSRLRHPCITTVMGMCMTP